jgi:hypothetical protein
LSVCRFREKDSLSEQDEDDAEPSGEADPKVRPGKRRSRKVETSTGDPRQKLRKEITSAAIIRLRLHVSWIIPGDWGKVKPGWLA